LAYRDSEADLSLGSDSLSLPIEGKAGKIDDGFGLGISDILNLSRSEKDHCQNDQRPA
jgi:hypothetical protein